MRWSVYKFNVFFQQIREISIEREKKVNIWTKEKIERDKMNKIGYTQKRKKGKRVP